MFSCSKKCIYTFIIQMKEITLIIETLKPLLLFTNLNVREMLKIFFSL